ncbi:flagellar basal body rod protein FlgB [Parasphingorhabdus cellanae]|uniref:Flagellar basal body rod protein FlgB n=1 Tax=Parasphingorhabdus cellanae TaxID=2806553 RepID=A0ABX7T7L4_9SPHN|nr:flagellar basal body rod protein FlgB [Parasphingorhabdus cellanae]QTD56492.1 flagellar basal body rod protein FlgB [Parasphingorhabdus cellanae]
MDKIFGIYGDALALRSQRLNMLASNIANAATPHFKARDLDFDKAIASVLDGTPLNDSVASNSRYRVPLQPAMDGNTVELSTEQTLFAENAVQYRSTLSFLEGRLGTLRRAMKGE